MSFPLAKSPARGRAKIGNFSLLYQFGQCHEKM
jgi:hypothetical protein